MTHSVVTPFGPVRSPVENIVPLHRGVRPINPATIARIHGDTDQAAEIERKQREELRYREQIRRQYSLFDRVADSLGSREGLIAYVSFIGGSLFTVAMAAVWAGVM